MALQYKVIGLASWMWFEIFKFHTIYSSFLSGCSVSLKDHLRCVSQKASILELKVLPFQWRISFWPFVCSEFLTLLSRDSLFQFFSRKQAPLAKAITDSEWRGGGHNLIFMLLHLISAFCSVLHSFRFWGQTGKFHLPVSLCRHLDLIFWSANSLLFPPYTFLLHMLWSRQYTSWFHRQKSVCFSRSCFLG